MNIVRTLIIAFMWVFVLHTNSAAKQTTFSVGLVIGANPAAPKISNASYTCTAAKVLLTSEGFIQVETLECSGKIFSFLVVSNGRNAVVEFNSASGQIVYNSTE